MSETKPKAETEVRNANAARVRGWRRTGARAHTGAVRPTAVSRHVSRPAAGTTMSHSALPRTSSRPVSLA
eukprot:6381026-Prymnesium_polylepis.1